LLVLLLPCPPRRTAKDRKGAWLFSSPSPVVPYSVATRYFFPGRSAVLFIFPRLLVKGSLELRGFFPFLVFGEGSGGGVFLVRWTLGLFFFPGSRGPSPSGISLATWSPLSRTFSFFLWWSFRARSRFFLAGEARGFLDWGDVLFRPSSHCVHNVFREGRAESPSSSTHYHSEWASFRFDFSVPSCVYEKFAEVARESSCYPFCGPFNRLLPASPRMVEVFSSCEFQAIFPYSLSL